MPDLYATIAEVDPEVQETLAKALEIRAAELRQKEMLETYLGWIRFPENARVLNIGCGTGPTTDFWRAGQGVGQVVGLDPSPVFLTKARAMAADHAQVRFQEGDARSRRLPTARSMSPSRTPVSLTFPGRPRRWPSCSE